MQKSEFDTVLEGLDIVQIIKRKTYRISAIITLLLLMGVMVGTFIYFVLPLQQFPLILAFIGGFVAGTYNIVMEFTYPEKHLHFVLKIPKDYGGWKVLFLISTCIRYDSEKNLLTIQFMDALEQELAKSLTRYINNEDSK